jgi:hypothetical protein
MHVMHYCRRGSAWPAVTRARATINYARLPCGAGARATTATAWAVVPVTQRPHETTDPSRRSSIPALRGRDGRNLRRIVIEPLRQRWRGVTLNPTRRRDAQHPPR